MKIRARNGAAALRGIARRTAAIAKIKVPGRAQRTAAHREIARSSARADEHFASAADRPGVGQSSNAAGIANHDPARAARERAAGENIERAGAAALADVDVGGAEGENAVAVDVHRAGATGKGEGRTHAHLDVIRRKIHGGTSGYANAIAHIEEAGAPVNTHPESARRRARTQNQRAEADIQLAVSEGQTVVTRADSQAARRPSIEGAAIADRQKPDARPAGAFADAHRLGQGGLIQRGTDSVNRHGTATRDRKTPIRRGHEPKPGTDVVVIDDKTGTNHRIRGRDEGIGNTRVPRKWITPFPTKDRTDRSGPGELADRNSEDWDEDFFGGEFHRERRLGRWTGELSG